MPLPATQSMDYVGKLHIHSGSSGEYIIPMRRGTRWSFPRNVDGEVFAQGGNGAIEPSSYNQGQVQPVLTVRTRCFSNWFTAVNLCKMLGTGATTIYGSGRVGASGFLTDLGNFRYQYGANTAKLWTSCMVDSLSLSWDDLGNPVDATIAFRPYGPRLAPVAATGTGVGAAQYEQFISGKGVSYSSTLTKVHAGSINWRNGLMPDFSTPFAANADGSLIPGDASTKDLKVYPSNYYPSPPRWTVSLTQDRDESATAITNEPGDTLGAFSVLFLNNAGSPATVTFDVTGALAPDEDETMAETLAMITRTYGNKTLSGNASMKIS